jgi:hypothetical protein
VGSHRLGLALGGSLRGWFIGQRGVRFREIMRRASSSMQLDEADRENAPNDEKGALER